MKEHNPDKTVPPLDSTVTQRFKPVTYDPDKTSPNLRMGTFPEHPVAKAEVPPAIERAPEVYYENGGTELHDVEEQPNGDIAGTDGNGIRFVIPKLQVGEWRKTK